MSRAVLATIVTSCYLLGACGAPTDPVDHSSPSQPPEATPSKQPTPSRAPTPSQSPTPATTPTPTPVPWDDYQIASATLSGDAIAAWASLEDEALLLTNIVVDELLAQETITPVQARAVLAAAEEKYGQIFSLSGANQGVGNALSNGSLDLTQRLTPLAGGGQLLEYFLWSSPEASADDARIASFPASGGVATGDLIIPIEVLTEPQATVVPIHLEAMVIHFGSLQGNTVAGLLPYDDLESLFTVAVQQTIDVAQLPPDTAASIDAQLQAFLDDLELTYSTQTLDDGRPALAIDISYDLTELPNGSKP